MRMWRCRVCKCKAPLGWFSKRGRWGHTCGLCRPLSGKARLYVGLDLANKDEVVTGRTVVVPCPDCGSDRVDCDCDEINAQRGARVGA